MMEPPPGPAPGLSCLQVRRIAAYTSGAGVSLGLPGWPERVAVASGSWLIATSGVEGHDPDLVGQHLLQERLARSCSSTTSSACRRRSSAFLRAYSTSGPSLRGCS